VTCAGARRAGLLQPVPADALWHAAPGPAGLPASPAGRVLELCGYQPALAACPALSCVSHVSEGALLTTTPRPLHKQAFSAFCATALHIGPYCDAFAEACGARQDMGPGYRNVIGIPGGVRSPLFKVLQVGDPAPAA